MSFHSLFDGSDAELLPKGIPECAAYLRQYNAWRRSDVEDIRKIEHPHPRELGLHIDFAADALDGIAIAERQRDELLAALQGLHKVCEIALSGKCGKQHAYFETRAGHFVEAAKAMQAAEAAMSSVKGDVPATCEEAETSAPAIVFYPAGSLGEAVDSEWGEA